MIVEKTIEEPVNEEMKRKIKELKQKNKLEIEIKENQVRSLKMKIEQQDDLIRDLECQEKPDTSMAEKK